MNTDERTQEWVLKQLNEWLSRWDFMEDGPYPEELAELIRTVESGTKLTVGQHEDILYHLGMLQQQLDEEAALEREEHRKICEPDAVSE